MKPVTELTKEQLRNIRLLVFDVDGILVPRGTKIKQIGNTTTLETKIVSIQLLPVGCNPERSEGSNNLEILRSKRRPQNDKSVGKN